MSAETSFFTDLVLEMLYIYLYDRWFHPYRSKFEYGQFLAKTIVPKVPSVPASAGPSDMADIIIPAHTTISTRAEETRLASMKHDPNHPKDTPLDPKLPKLDLEGIRKDRSLSEEIRSQEFFILQPLFRALTVVIRSESVTDEVTNISQVSVLLVRTGVEEGLSALISFDPTAHQITGLAHRSGGETRQRSRRHRLCAWNCYR